MEGVGEDGRKRPKHCPDSQNGEGGGAGRLRILGYV